MSAIPPGYPAPALSPRERAQQQLDDDVQSCAIGPNDGAAIGKALDDIDSALSASDSADTPDPARIKDKIDGLVDAQVASGKLTTDQAVALKRVFAQIAPPRAAGSDNAAGNSAHALSAAPTGGSDPAGDPADSDISALLRSFLETLQQAQQQTGYGAGGAAKTQPTGTSLLFNYNV